MQFQNSYAITPVKSENADSPTNLRQSSSDVDKNLSSSTYCPAKMHIIKVLRNDTQAKCLCLHVKFEDSLDTDAIAIFSKLPFPSDKEAICDSKLGQPHYNENETIITDFPPWCADEIVDNDIFHRFNVTAGLEKLNTVNMTVIHPAGPQHFAKYTTSQKRIIYESPDIYRNIIVPFLASSPRELAWVDNILNGTAEAERVLFSDPDETFGFSFVLDYRWDGRQLNELHFLSLAKSTDLTCLRDLRACHIPMLKKMLEEGRKSLVAKYSVAAEGDYITGSGLSEDKIIAYFHYPPTFYRLHMHFAHVDGAADGGTQSGKAHLAEDVIANLELKNTYYADRTMTMYLHDNHAFLAAINATKSK